MKCSEINEKLLSGNSEDNLSEGFTIYEQNPSGKGQAVQSGMLELLFKHSLSAIAILDRDFNFIRVNEAYAKADNRDVSDFPGHNHFEFYPSDARAIFEEVVETKKPYRVYARPFIYPDNPERGVTYWDWSLVPELNDRGEIDFLIFTLNDVTERIKSENILERFFELSQDVLCISDLKGYIRRVSPSVEKHLGYSSEEIVGKNLADLLHPEDLETTISQRNITILHNRPLNCYRSRFVCKDGTDKWFEWTSIPALDEGLVYSVARDITKNKLVENRLLQLASIIQSTDDAIIGLTTEGIITSWNPGAEKMYGYTTEDVQGKHISMLFPPNYENELEYITEAIKQGKRINDYETVRQRKDGKHIYVSITLSPIINANGYTIGSSAIIKDITGRKQIEKEMARLDRLNLVGQMAAGIGHEIRNPMTAIRGLLQLLMDKKECKRFKEYFDLMIYELDRANSIITEYLSLARNKKHEVYKQNINSILNALYPLIKADAMRTDKDILLELEDVPDLMLNEKEIRQLILNLARNGIEAMSPGGRLTIKTFADGEEEVVLAVQDQGKGIASDTLDKIGTPFFTTKDNGTGLGLATCYSIAARHNAGITIETNPEGTTFFVRFGANIS